MERVVYRAGKFGRHVGTCGLCGVEHSLITDHCHRHGLIRGSLCDRCNYWMGRHDRRHIPEQRVGSSLWLSCWNWCSDDRECRWAGRCPGCFQYWNEQQHKNYPPAAEILKFIALVR